MASKTLLVTLAQIVQLIDGAPLDKPAEHMDLIRQLLEDREVVAFLDEMHRKGVFAELPEGCC